MLEPSTLRLEERCSIKHVVRVLYTYTEHHIVLTAAIVVKVTQTDQTELVELPNRKCRVRALIFADREKMYTCNHRIFGNSE